MLKVGLATMVCPRPLPLKVPIFYDCFQSQASGGVSIPCLPELVDDRGRSWGCLGRTACLAGPVVPMVSVASLIGPAAAQGSGWRATLQRDSPLSRAGRQRAAASERLSIRAGVQGFRRVLRGELFCTVYDENTIYCRRFTFLVFVQKDRCCTVYFEEMETPTGPILAVVEGDPKTWHS